MSLSLNNPEADILCIESGNYDELLIASRQSSRRRMIMPIQRTQSAAVQRLLNAFQMGTYIRPHKHPQLDASETIVLLQGELGVIIYDTSGVVKSTHRLKKGSIIDLEPHIWHSMVCLAPNTVIAEFKNGPYDAKLDKEFAPWSPEEGTADVARFLKQSEKEFL
ncbi:MAG: WbuC family cupin fold metalloprotein [Akkermansiaceae bacterium]